MSMWRLGLRWHPEHYHFRRNSADLITFRQPERINVRNGAVGKHLMRPDIACSDHYFSLDDITYTVWGDPRCFHCICPYNLFQCQSEQPIRSSEMPLFLSGARDINRIRRGIFRLKMGYMQTFGVDVREDLISWYSVLAAFHVYADRYLLRTCSVAGLDASNVGLSHQTVNFVSSDGTRPALNPSDESTLYK